MMIRTWLLVISLVGLNCPDVDARAFKQIIHLKVKRSVPDKVVQPVETVDKPLIRVKRDTEPLEETKQESVSLERVKRDAESLEITKREDVSLDRVKRDVVELIRTKRIDVSFEEEHASADKPLARATRDTEYLIRVKRDAPDVNPVGDKSLTRGVDSDLTKAEHPELQTENVKEKQEKKDKDTSKANIKTLNEDTKAQVGQTENKDSGTAAEISSDKDKVDEVAKVKEEQKSESAEVVGEKHLDEKIQDGKLKDAKDQDKNTLKEVKNQEAEAPKEGTGQDKEDLKSEKGQDAEELERQKEEKHQDAEGLKDDKMIKVNEKNGDGVVGKDTEAEEVEIKSWLDGADTAAGDDDADEIKAWLGEPNGAVGDDQLVIDPLDSTVDDGGDDKDAEWDDGDNESYWSLIMKMFNLNPTWQEDVHSEEGDGSWGTQKDDQGYLTGDVIDDGDGKGYILDDEDLQKNEDHNAKISINVLDSQGNVVEKL